MNAHLISRLFRRGALSLALLAATGLAAAAETTHHLNLDFSALSGSGWLDLQFNPGSAAALPATVQISNLVGFDTASVPTLDGGVSAIPGGYLFSNAFGLNALFQSVNFGGNVSFDLTIASGDTVDAGSSFLVGAYTADFGLIGNATEANPWLARFDLLPGVLTGGAVVVESAVYDTSIATISAVPEPSSWLMLGVGAMLLAGAARRRAA